MGFRLIVEVGKGVKDPATIATLAKLHLEAVIASNRVLMRIAKHQGKPLPKLYESGVIYEREPWGGEFEEFAGVMTLLERGWGDCEDLAAWRCAELLEEGEKASIRIYWRPRKRGKTSSTMHVEVRRGDGRIEDPSRFLGL